MEERQQFRLGIFDSGRAVLTSFLLADIDEDVVWDWVDEIRDAINHKAIVAGARPRDCAATLVAILVASAIRDNRDS